VAAHHLRIGFRNVDPHYSYPLLERAGHALRAPARPRGEPLFVVKNDGDELRANQQAPTITWIGHSTFLVQIDGLNILTDPHWGERTSPVSFAGRGDSYPRASASKICPPSTPSSFRTIITTISTPAPSTVSRASTIPGSSCPSA
jgi:N-acyl-phosphatidylethanolamine-hydrolysing phospholipase D